MSSWRFPLPAGPKTVAHLILPHFAHPPAAAKVFGSVGGYMSGTREVLALPQPQARAPEMVQLVVYSLLCASGSPGEGRVYFSGRQRRWSD